MKLYTVSHLLCTNYKYTIITKLFSILNVTKYNNVYKCERCITFLLINILIIQTFRFIFDNIS